MAELGSVKAMEDRMDKEVSALDAKLAQDQADGNYGDVTALCLALLCALGINSQVIQVAGVEQYTAVATQIGTNVYNIVSCMQYLEENASSSGYPPGFWSEPETEQKISQMAEASFNLFYEDKNLNVPLNDCGVNIGGTTYYIYVQAPAISSNPSSVSFNVTVSTTPPGGTASDLDLMLSMSLADGVKKGTITPGMSPSQMASAASNGPIIKTMISLGESLDGLGTPSSYNGSDPAYGSSFLFNMYVMGWYYYVGNPSKMQNGYENLVNALTADGEQYANNLNSGNPTYGQSSPLTEGVQDGQNAQKGISSTSNQMLQVAKIAMQLIEELVNTGNQLNKGNSSMVNTMVKGQTN